jgi:exosortase A-associated hydrolase 2
MAAPQHRPAEAFFLETRSGKRYCLFHLPQGRCRGALLYVHPFAEEMNKTRRMAATQARELAALGFGVLQVDMYGCGDSDGEFGDARWEISKQDLADASDWLRRRLDHPVGLWGLRLGALLALDYARQPPQPVARLVLWQPVQSGATFLTQFLRLRVASEMLAAPGNEAVRGTEAMRSALQAGEMLEIAGYEVTAALAAALDAVEAAALAPTGCPVDWFEVVAGPERQLPAAAALTAARWREQGTALQIHLIHCAPFWATQEIAECPALLAATSSMFREARHG